jgi:hypothetical protein
VTGRERLMISISSDKIDSGQPKLNHAIDGICSTTA